MNQTVYPCGRADKHRQNHELSQWWGTGAIIPVDGGPGAYPGFLTTLSLIALQNDARGTRDVLSDRLEGKRGRPRLRVTSSTKQVIYRIIIV